MQKTQNEAVAPSSLSDDEAGKHVGKRMKRGPLVCVFFFLRETVNGNIFLQAEPQSSSYPMHTIAPLVHLDVLVCGFSSFCVSFREFEKRIIAKAFQNFSQTCGHVMIL